MMWCEDCKKYVTEVYGSIKHKTEEDLEYGPYVCDLCHIRRCHYNGALPLFDKVSGELVKPWKSFTIKNKYNLYCKNCLPANITWEKKDIERLRARCIKFIQNSSAFSEFELNYILDQLPSHCDDSQAQHLNRVLIALASAKEKQELYDDSIYLKQWFINAEKEDSLDRWCALFAPANWAA